MIDCPTSCSDILPVAKYDYCDPEVKFGEIRKIFFATIDADPFVDWENMAEWYMRVDNDDDTDINAIRELTVSADKPQGEYDDIMLSNNRRVRTSGTHTINISIDDNSDANYDLARWAGCNTTIKFWYVTKTKMYGGNDGITGNLHLNEVIERGNKGIKFINGTLTWEARYAPDRADYEEIPSFAYLAYDEDLLVYDDDYLTI
jgi:hypothetical protein